MSPWRLTEVSCVWVPMGAPCSCGQNAASIVPSAMHSFNWSLSFDSGGQQAGVQDGTARDQAVG